MKVQVIEKKKGQINRTTEEGNNLRELKEVTDKNLKDLEEEF